MTPVPFNNFTAQVAEIRPQIDAAIARVLDRGHFILGPETEAFEKAFAEFLGADQAIGVANGTEALQLALMALGIGEGDEVICPVLTAAPTALAILGTGAKPVFADVDPETGCIDPLRLDECLSEKTRAIMPVHLYGLAADIPAICEFANAHNLPVIEDCAQAHGAEINGRKVGTFTQVGAFSFYPTKNVGAYGDGGAVVTSDDAINTKVRQLRDLGQTGRFQHTFVGRNSRLDEIQAAILQVKLAHLNEQNAARRERAGWYAELLNGVQDLTLPVTPKGYTPVYHLYVVRHTRRDELKAHLRELGIGCDVHYPLPLNRQGAFTEFRVAKGGVDVAEKVISEILSLPMYPQLTREQVEQVAEGVRGF